MFIRTCGVGIGFWFYSGSVLSGCVKGMRKLVSCAFFFAFRVDRNNLDVKMGNVCYTLVINVIIKQNNEVS